MKSIDELIQFWGTYLDTHESRLTDKNYLTIISTLNQLKEFKKLKERVDVQLPLGTDNSHR